VILLGISYKLGVTLFRKGFTRNGNGLVLSNFKEIKKGTGGYIRGIV